MNLTLNLLDKLSAHGHVHELLAFRPGLPLGHHQCFVVLATVNIDGEQVIGPLRTAAGNVKEYRTTESLEKLCRRWRLGGIFMACTDNTAAQHRLRHLSAADMRHLAERTDMARFERSPA